MGGLVEYRGAAPSPWVLAFDSRLRPVGQGRQSTPNSTPENMNMGRHMGRPTGEQDSKDDAPMGCLVALRLTQQPGF